ncbi:hypothetical protein FGO68_gene9142 [Halteria grandinella]|uniref:Uncharacterized protein n=1 Tax=Halteria grandinella TaxID=5974 RepID=A0A8J8NR32_HALGN|nr:hypothetical protein FGO68_gene9142 [Halteria grandinella]
MAVKKLKRYFNVTDTPRVIVIAKDRYGGVEMVSTEGKEMIERHGWKCLKVIEDQRVKQREAEEMKRQQEIENQMMRQDSGQMQVQFTGVHMPMTQKSGQLDPNQQLLVPQASGGFLSQNPKSGPKSQQNNLQLPGAGALSQKQPLSANSKPPTVNIDDIPIITKNSGLNHALLTHQPSGSVLQPQKSGQALSQQPPGKVNSKSNALLPDQPDDDLPYEIQK